jgi:hypothetical protein
MNTFLVFLLVVFGIIWAIGKLIGGSKKPAKLFQPADNKNSASNIFMESLLEKHSTIIQKYSDSIQYRSNASWHYVDDKVRDCLNELLSSEGKTSIAPNNNYLSRWERNAPEPYKRLASEMKQQFRQKLAKLEKNAKSEQLIEDNKRAEILFNKYQDLFKAFLFNAERKVSTLDSYGDENLEALDEECNFAIMKIAKKEGISETELESWKKYTFAIATPYRILRERIKAEFGKYHNQMKSSGNFDYSQLDGIGFENYIIKFLKDNGFQVLGTPATGDQGADAILLLDNLKIVIQTKNYRNPVGNKAIQEVIAAKEHYKADIGWVITTSTFTKSAIELAVKSEITLIQKPIESFIKEEILKLQAANKQLSQ